MLNINILLFDIKRQINIQENIKMVNFKRNSLITLSICNMIKLKYDIMIKHKKLIYKDIKNLSLIMKLIS